MNVDILCPLACRRRLAAFGFYRFLLPFVILMTLLPLQADARTVVEWDFSSGVHGWTGNHHVTDLTYSRRGLSFASKGVDPWIEGPAVNLQTDRLMKVTIRVKSNANSTGELFYGSYFRAGHSVRFAINNDGDWHDYADNLGVAG